MEKTNETIYNEETRKAIEDARRGIGLTKGYHSAEELFAALDAEENEEESADDESGRGLETRTSRKERT